MITKAIAEKALEAVTKRYQKMIDECGLEKPVLISDYDEFTPWLISWEAGPFEWALRVCNGGINEEIYDTLRYEFNASEERARKAAMDKAIDFPKGVAVDVYYTYALTVYAA
jgi:hypothetical protein